MKPVIWGLLLFAPPVLAQAPVKFGISPWTTPQLLQAWAKPVEKALEKQTGVAFQISSSANLQKYLLAAVDGQFEMMQAPMHLGLYLIRHHNFKGVMFSRAKLKLILVTRRALSIDHLGQLKGTSMAVSGPVAIATLVVKEAMVNKLFEAQLVPERNHWQAMESLHQKRTHSAVVVDYLYGRLSSPLKSRLKVLYEFPVILDGLILTPPNSSSEFRANIHNALKNFKPHKSSLLKSFEKITQSELNEWYDVMNAYVASVHRYMEQEHFSKGFMSSH